MSDGTDEPAASISELLTYIDEVETQQGLRSAVRDLEDRAASVGMVAREWTSNAPLDAEDVAARQAEVDLGAKYHGRLSAAAKRCQSVMGCAPPIPTGVLSEEAVAAYEALCSRQSEISDDLHLAQLNHSKAFFSVVLEVPQPPFDDKAVVEYQNELRELQTRKRVRFVVSLLAFGLAAAVTLVALAVRDLREGQAKTWFKEGSAAHQSGDYQSAERLLRKSLRRKPENKLGHFYLGEALLAQGKYTTDTLETFERSKGSGWRASSCQGLIRFEQGDSEAAVEYWRAAVGQCGGDYSATDLARYAGQCAHYVSGGEPLTISEPLLAIATARYASGDRSQQTFELARSAVGSGSALSREDWRAQILWGEKLRAAVRELLADERMTSTDVEPTEQTADEPSDVGTQEPTPEDRSESNLGGGNLDLPRRAERDACATALAKATAKVAPKVTSGELDPDAGSLVVGQMVKGDGCPDPGEVVFTTAPDRSSEQSAENQKVSPREGRAREDLASKPFGITSLKVSVRRGSNSALTFEAMVQGPRPASVTVRYNPPASGWKKVSLRHAGGGRYHARVAIGRANIGTTYLYASAQLRPGLTQSLGSKAKAAMINTAKRNNALFTQRVED